MKKKMILLASLFVLSGVTAVHAQEDNSERIAEIEAQIAELQNELDGLKSSSDDVSTDQEDASDYLGVLESRGHTFKFKDAYMFDDDDAPSGKSVLFIIEYTNNTGKSNEPSSGVISEVNAIQESDVQIFDLRSTRVRDRRDLETYKNRNIDLKDGASIEFEYGFKLEFVDSPLVLKGSYLSDARDEVILELDPNNLEQLP